MHLLVTATNAQACGEAMALLGRDFPQWDLSACVGASAYSQALRPQTWDLVVWDVGLGPLGTLVDQGMPASQVVAWGEPALGSVVSEAYRLGAAGYLVRASGWQDCLGAVIARAAADRPGPAEKPVGAHARPAAESRWTVEVDEAGRILQCGAAVADLLGHQASELCGAPLDTVLEPAGLGRALLEVLASDQAPTSLMGATGAISVREVDGGLLMRALLADAAGRCLAVDLRVQSREPDAGAGGARLILRPVTRQPEPAPLRPAAVLEPVVTPQPDGSLPVATATVSPDGVILRHNPAFGELVSGAPSGDLCGRRLQEFAHESEALSTALGESLRPGGSARVTEMHLRRQQGASLACLVAATPTSDEAGQAAVTVTAMRLERAAGADPAAAMDSRLEPMAEAVAALSRAQTVPGVLEATVEQMPRFAPAEFCMMVTRDVETGETVWHSRGIAGERQPDLAAALLEAAVPGARLTLLPDEGGAGPALAQLGELCAREGMCHACGVPLTANGSVVGSLLVGTASPEAGYSPQARSRVELLATEAAHVTANLILWKALEQSAGAQQKLVDVSLALSAVKDLDTNLRMVAETALEIGSGEWAAIEILDEEAQQFEASHVALARPEAECAQVRSGPAAWEAVRAGALVVLPAEDGQGAATMAIPLMLDRGPIGVLSVQRRSGLGFRKQEVRGLRLLAAQAAVSVHDAQLYEVAQRRSQHMEVIAAQAWQEEARARALFEVATAVTEKTDLHDILSDVTRSACTEIGFERARTYLADHERQTLEGRVEARHDAAPMTLQDEAVPLRQGVGGRLADAALGTGPYMIDSVTEGHGPAAEGYERLYVPLVTQNMLVGLIVADNPETRNPVTPQQTRLLRSLAGLASVAIERARVERLRGTLISSVSHELRAPLASIRAYNELVMSGDAGEINEDQHIYLERVETASRRLERLISDLMNLSKLRAGDVSVLRAPTDLNRVVSGVLDTLSPKAHELGVSLHFEPVPDLLAVLTDQGRLEQVLTNLVDNAIKFGNPGGWVRVRVSREGDDAVLSVADDGPGIPASHHSLVFEEFHHGTDARSRAKEGAGLGLAIAKRVVEVLGGRIRLESEPGHGTTFHVSIPMETAPTTTPGGNGASPQSPPNDAGEPHGRA